MRVLAQHASAADKKQAGGQPIVKDLRTKPRKVFDGALRCTEAMPAVRPDFDTQPGLRANICDWPSRTSKK